MIPRATGSRAGGIGPNAATGARGIATAAPDARGLDAEVVVHRGGFTLAAAFTVAPGEVVAVVGPNGAGKSTLTGALAGLVPLAEGRVALDGAVLDEPRTRTCVPPARRGLGVVFQDLRLFPARSVLDNVAFGLRARGVGRRAARAQAHAVLERVGAAGVAQRRPAQLSGGQAQRVAIARALAIQPRALVLDEPLSALDVTARAALRSLLREVVATFRGPCVLVTHHPLEALALGDRLVVLEGGRVVQAGTPEQIRLHPRSAFAAAFVGVNLLRGRLERVDGGLVVRAEEGSLAVAEPAAGAPIATGAAVVATLAPSAVTLHRDPPHGSARNVIAALVTGVEVEAGRARVRLEGRPPLVAEVTAAAAAALGLAPGERVWATVKATEVRLDPL